MKRGFFAFVLMVLVCVLQGPGVANAAGIPIEGWCVYKIGNTWGGGCDDIYKTQEEAGEAALRYGNGNGFDKDMNPSSYPNFKWVDSQHCEPYYGANQVRCHRSYTYENSTYPGVIIGPSDAGQFIIPICPLLPGQTTRAYPGGTDPTAGCGTNLVVFHPEKTGDAKHCKTQNPISPLTGIKTLNEDLGVAIGKTRVAMLYDTRFNIYYDDPTVVPNKRTLGLPVAVSGLGTAWRTSLHKALTLQTVPGQGGGIVTFRVGDNLISFDRTNNQPLEAGTRETLTTSGSDYLLTLTNGDVETYTGANVSRINYASGGYLAFSYTVIAGQYMLTKVQDDQGRTIALAYDATAQLTSLTAPNGSVINFTSQAAQGTKPRNLTSIQWPDGAVRTYLYEKPPFIQGVTYEWAVTGVIDEHNIRLMTYTYDGNGRAIEEQGLLGSANYTIGYATPPSLTSTTTVLSQTLIRTDVYYAAPTGVNIGYPNGRNQNVGTVSIGQYAYGTASSDQPAGSGCVASSSATTYDSNGNITSEDDFSGQRICYAYDSSNRQTARVEGLSNTVACSSVLPTGALPSGARKITTTWHPAYRLAATVATPGTTTTTVYQGQPDPFNNNAVANCTSAATLPNGKVLPVVCKQIVQAMKGPKPTDVVDPNFASVSLLLNAESGVEDSSNFKVGFTRLGYSAVTTQTKIGAKVLQATGASYITTTSNDVFKFGTGDFTLEGWFRFSSFNVNNGAAVLFDTRAKSGGSGGFNFGVTPTALFGGGLTIANHSMVLNNWYHVAFSRQGTTLRGFVNGAMVGSVTDSGGHTSGEMTIGACSYGPVGVCPFNGYMDEVIVTKGIAKYTTNFTPTTLPEIGPDPVLDIAVPASTNTHTYNASGKVLTSTDTSSRTTNYAYYTDSVMDGQPVVTSTASPTSLLLNAESGLVDSSNYVVALTQSGYSAVTTQTKVGAKVLQATGSSYITTSSNDLFKFGTGDYTVEGWFNFSSFAVNSGLVGLFDTRAKSGGAGGSVLGVSPTEVTTFYPTKLVIGTNSMALNTWNHIAFVRQSGTLKAYVNGTLIGSAADTINHTSGELTVGACSYSPLGACPFNGYMDEVIVTKGKARYTANFTPSNAPASPEIPVQTTLTPASKGHMVGDLQSITEPGGFVTTFNLYDPTGKIVQMTDPKGVVTDITYTLRGFVKTVTTTAPGLPARTTTYNYDNVGQVTGVVQPDGSTVNYSYDAAHRLVGVTDAKGNSITYTLDNMGNRINEQLKDPQGVLQRQVQRSFDALNRVQQVTGAPR